MNKEKHGATGGANGKGQQKTDQNKGLKDEKSWR
jgi:hypothetical protein